MERKIVIKDPKFSRERIQTELALERTILAKQRTILAEISVFMGIIGLSLLLARFYTFLVVEIISGLVSLFAVYRIGKLTHTYKKFKRKIKKIDKRNRYFH